MRTKATFPVLLEAFFTDRLMRQKKASPNTIASHRDTFRLLLGFAQERLKKSPSTLTIEDLDAPFVGSFLEYLEKERGNTARSRNVRLAGIHSFFKYVALEEPSCSALAQRILAMPNKRFKRRSIEFLTRPEIEALLSAPDQSPGYSGVNQESQCSVLDPTCDARERDVRNAVRRYERKRRLPCVLGCVVVPVTPQNRFSPMLKAVRSAVTE